MSTHVIIHGEKEKVSKGIWKPFYKAGNKGKHYHYTASSSRSAITAFRKATKQHQAVIINIMKKKKSKK